MDANKFIQNDINERFGEGTQIRNDHYSADQWIDKMEQYVESIKPTEYILCAAIWYKEIPLKKIIPGVLPKNCDKGLVVTGHRHGQCIWTMGCLTGLRSVTNAPDGVGDYEQGFLTNKNRFVGREEAGIIAFNANQTNKLMNPLYSEDLY